MARGEEEDGDEREGGPEVAVLQERQHVGRRDGDDADAAEDGGGDGENLHPVDGARDLGLVDVGGELAGDPGVDLFGGLGAVECQLVESVRLV